MFRFSVKTLEKSSRHDRSVSLAHAECKIGQSRATVEAVLPDVLQNPDTFQLTAPPSLGLDPILTIQYSS